MPVLLKLVTITCKHTGNQQSVDFLTGALTFSGSKPSMSLTSQLPLEIMVKRQVSLTGVHLMPSATPSLICAAR